MGYAVLNIKKASGNDSATSAHIERTIDPKNADKTRTHLNKELIHFPDGVNNRTEAIQYRIEHAGITRKINEKQVRALRFMLTGSPEDMQRIQSENRLDDWCRDSLDWVKETFGKNNLVSAVLHMDEKTPHIHATVVPIVSGERRKAKASKPEAGKKKYRKKNPNAARLCADDVTARDKLTGYQDSYAERMRKYGLQRGVRGSEAKEKFLDMDRHVKDKKEELATVETNLQKVKQDYEPYKAQEELNQIHELFPMMKEQLRIADFCRKIGLAIESIKALLTGKTLTAKLFSFFSPEHKQSFTAEDVKLKIDNKPDNPNKLRLNINGMDILGWFRTKFQEVKFSKKPEIIKNKGVKV